MKNLFSPIALLILVGGLFNSCMSDQQKKEAADAQVVIAVDNLDQVQKHADIFTAKVATAKELKTFKLESDLKIKNNEVLIAKLKLKMNEPGLVLDDIYAKRIDSLELKNRNLKTRMGDYERTHSNWSKFKNDFNRDLDDLGNKLKEYAKDNLK